MAHFSTLLKVVIDVPGHDYDRERSFWDAATGAGLKELRHPEYHGAAIPGHDFFLLTQHIEEGSARVHLDIHTDDLEAEVTRLERLGAHRLHQAHGWWIMQDPAGLTFCVIPEEPGELDESNAQRWED